MNKPNRLTPDEFDKICKEMSERLQMDMRQHMEEMAAAFVLKTMIAPDRAVMNIRGDVFTGLKIWFEEKKDV